MKSTNPSMKEAVSLFVIMVVIFCKLIGHCFSAVDGISGTMHWPGLAFSCYSKMMYINSVLYLSSLYECLRHPKAFQIDPDGGWGIWLSKGRDLASHGQQ